MGAELLQALTVAAVAAAALFAAGTVLGMVVIARRRGGSPRSADPLLTEADGWLLRLDERIAEARDEVAFASAQFGASHAEEYRAATDTAARRLDEAFRLRRRLDDPAASDSPRRREWARTIISACRAAAEELEAQDARFRRLRLGQDTAPVEAAALSERARRLDDALRGREAALDAASARFGAAPVQPARGALSRSRQLLGESAALVRELDAGTGRPAADLLADADERLHRAEVLADSAERAERELAQAEQGLGELVSRARLLVSAARAAAASAPDADSAQSITDAAGELSDQLAALPPPGAERDPRRWASLVEAAMARVDTALATARNQEQRLAAAREALAGALLTGRGAIQAALAAVRERQGAERSGARARLAEAQRELAAAEHEADPVLALDAARRAATHARDAEALARYSGR